METQIQLPDGKSVTLVHEGELTDEAIRNAVSQMGYDLPKPAAEDHSTAREIGAEGLRLAGALGGALVGQRFGMPGRGGLAGAALVEPLANMLQPEPADLGMSAANVLTAGILPEAKAAGLGGRLLQGAKVGAALGGAHKTIQTLIDEGALPSPDQLAPALLGGAAVGAPLEGILGPRLPGQVAQQAAPAVATPATKEMPITAALDKPKPSTLEGSNAQANQIAAPAAAAPEATAQATPIPPAKEGAAPARASLDDEDAIEAAAAAQANKQEQAPDTTYQYTIQKPQKLGDKTIPGFVQVDKIQNGDSVESGTVDSFRKQGVDLPDAPEHLPQGQYTADQVKEAIAKEDEIKKAASEFEVPALGAEGVETPYRYTESKNGKVTLDPIPPKFLNLVRTDVFRDRPFTVSAYSAEDAAASGHKITSGNSIKKAIRDFLGDDITPEFLSKRYNGEFTPQELRDYLGIKAPKQPERIASAAVKFSDGEIRTGKNHAEIVNAIGEKDLRGSEDGFVTTAGRYVDREEGMKIAKAAEQVTPGIDRKNLAIELLTDRPFKPNEVPEAVQPPQNVATAPAKAEIPPAQESAPKAPETPVLAGKILHSLRNEEDLPSVLENGLKTGSNITQDGGRPNQSIGSGGITLVYAKDAVPHTTKGYNENEGVVSKQVKAKPEAILIDRELLPTEPAVNAKDLEAQLVAATEKANQEAEASKALRNQLEAERKAMVEKVKVTEDSGGNRAIFRVEGDPEGVFTVWNRDPQRPRAWRSGNRTIFADNIPDLQDTIARERFSQELKSIQRRIDASLHDGPAAKAADALVAKLDKAYKAGGKTGGVSEAQAVKKLIGDTDIPVYLHDVDDNGEAVNIKRIGGKTKGRTAKPIEQPALVAPAVKPTVQEQARADLSNLAPAEKPVPAIVKALQAAPEAPKVEVPAAMPPASPPPPPIVPGEKSPYEPGGEGELKVRKHVGNLLESDVVPPEFKAALKADPEILYEVHNQGEWKNAAEAATDNELRQMIDQASKPDEKVVYMDELSNRLVAQKKYDEAAAMKVAASKLGTTGGQIVRATGFVRTAVGDLLSAQQLVERAGKKLTPEQSLKVLDLSSKEIEAQKVLNAAERKAREFYSADALKAYQEAQQKVGLAKKEFGEYMDSIAPRNFADMLVKIIQGNLMAPMSQVANITGNVMFGPMQRTSMSIASVMDAMLTGSQRLAAKALGASDAELARIGRSISATNPLPSSEELKAAGRAFVTASKEILTGPGENSYYKAEVQKGFRPLRSLMDSITGSNLPVNEKGVVGRWDRTKAFIEGTLGVPPEAMFRLLALGDKPFRRAAEVRALLEQARIKNIPEKDLEKFINFPDPASARAAIEAGQRAVFAEPNRGITTLNRFLDSDMAKLLKVDKIPLLAGAMKVFGRLTVPFRQFPLNYALTTMNFALPPLAFSKGAYYAYRAAEVAMDKGIPAGQRALRALDYKRRSLTNIGEGMLGMMMYTAADILWKHGLISESPAQTAQGRSVQSEAMGASKLNITGLDRYLQGQDPSYQKGDKLIDWTRFGIPAVMFHIYTEQASRGQAKASLLGNKAETQPLFTTSAIVHPGETLSNMAVAAPGIGSFIFEQSFLAGTSSLMEAIKDPDPDSPAFKNWLQNMFRAVSSTVAPATLEAVARARMDYIPEMRGKDLPETLSNIWKFKTLQLPASDQDVVYKRDTWGRPIPRTPEGANKWAYNLLDVSKMGSQKADPADQALYDLYKETNQPSVYPGPVGRTFTMPSGDTVELTPAYVEKLQEYVGEQRRTMMEHFVSSALYDKLTPFERVLALEGLYTKANSIGRQQFLAQSGILRDQQEENPQNKVTSRTTKDILTRQVLGVK